MDKKYISPKLTMVEFSIENGFASSLVGCAHEGFLGELWGHESFEDETITDIDEITNWETF